MLKIKIASVPVDDQDKAAKFYTDKLGFVIKNDLPVGEYRWLTVVAPDDLDGAELALEPNENPTVRRYQKEIFEQQIPATCLMVDDIQSSYTQLSDAGVEFAMGPTEMGGTTVAVFDDTVGNLIMIAQG
jgi:catechol 2,3-dioxygenase-like lactoylglutathione lyase family enzyme